MFSRSTALQELNIPASINKSTFGRNAFEYCTALGTADGYVGHIKYTFDETGKVKASQLYDYIDENTEVAIDFDDNGDVFYLDGNNKVYLTDSEIIRFLKMFTTMKRLLRLEKLLLRELNKQ